jgi:hypothetical protein
MKTIRAIQFLLIPLVMSFSVSGFSQHHIYKNKSIQKQSYSSFNSSTGISNKTRTKSYYKDSKIQIMPSSFGETSNKTGRPKTKSVNGYYKSNGTYVNPYYRS